MKYIELDAKKRYSNLSTLIFIPFCYFHSRLFRNFQGRYFVNYSQGCAIAQAVSRWLPTAAARVRARV
jgi:hypothetical protein